ncbi:MAG: macro domain-containing protein [Planctomycetota bacterium]
MDADQRRFTTEWRLIASDILDVAADVLICSANPHLNLSGGVGGSFLLRYGDEMQRLLHQSLEAQGKRFVDQGEVIAMPPCGSPYQAVLHAVGVDGFYQSSPKIVGDVVSKALGIADEYGAEHVALSAIATGFGRMPVADFADGIRHLLKVNYSSIRRVTICMSKPEDIKVIHQRLPGTQILRHNP